MKRREFKQRVMQSGVRHGSPWHIVAWSLAPAAVLVAVLLSPAPALAAESCPNEQLRAENNSTQLPDCRAYELVTPVEKLGHSVQVATSQEELGAVVSPDGLHVFFTSNGAYGDQLSGLAGVFQATRSPAGWLSTTVAPIYNAEHPGFGEINEYGPKGAPLDLSTFFYKRNERGVFVEEGGEPHEQIFHGTVYARYPGGEFANISQNSTGQSTYVGSSADGSHVILEMAPLVTEVGGQTGGVESLFDSTGGHVFPVGVGNDGLPASTCGSILAGTYSPEEFPTNASIIGSPGKFVSAVSGDGSTVFFESPDPRGGVWSSDPNCARAGELYLRQNNATTTEVSLSQKTGSVGSPAPNGAEFEGAAADASRVFFHSRDQLTNDAAASEGGLYEYDVATRTLTFIAREAEVLGNPGNHTLTMPPQISSDGTHVYFYGTVPGNGPSGRNLYLWDDGRISFIVRAGGVPIPLSETSADGSTLAFMTTANLTAYDSGGQPEIYVYEASGGTLACISCDPNGAPPVGQPQLYGRTFPQSQQEVRDSPLVPLHSVTSDGSRVFFDSPDPLLPGATNGLYNVYEYQNGGLQLLSDGNGPYESRLAGASSDGTDVIIGTYDSLVPQDQGSNNGNLYDVRVGGGLPAPVTPLGCAEACQGQPAAPPVLPSAASASYPGGENLVSPPVAAPASKPLTRAQKLTKALKACRAKRNKHKRARCEAEARTKYGAAHKAKKTNRKRG